MRDFEKKLALKLKDETEKIVPECREFDLEMKEGTNMEEENQRAEPSVPIKRRRPVWRRRVFVSAAVIILVFMSIFSFEYFSESEGGNYSFQIISFAGSEGIDQNQIEEKLLKANISMVMPHGQITLNPELTMDSEPWEWAYGWGTGSFYVVGKDIERVTYSIKKGTISHYDHAMELKLNTEGNPVRIEFFLPYSALEMDESRIDEYQLEEKYTERLKELWNSGKCPELEEAKKSYFAGKSLDIEDYTIMNFVGGWEAAKTDGRYFRFRDIALDEQLNKEGQKITVEYYHFDYGTDVEYHDSIYSVLWSPTFEPYSTVGVTNPEDLPGDEMTVTVELQNGEVIKKVIELSFDKEGYAVAEIKKGLLQ